MRGGLRVDPDYAEWLAAQQSKPAIDPDFAEWQAAQQPKESFFSKAATSLGRGGVDLLSLLGSAGDIMSGQYLGRMIGSAVSGVPQAPTMMDQAQSLKEQYFPKPQSDSALERIALGGIEALPFAAIPGGPLAGRIAAALGAGVGGQAAEEVGAPPLAGALIGGFAPGAVASTAKAVFRPLTQSGREYLAGKELLANAGSEGQKRLLSNLDDAASYAEVAGTTPAASFQSAIRRGATGEGREIIERGLVDIPKQQAEDVLRTVAPGSLSGVSQTAKGEILQSKALEKIGKEWDRAGKTFEALQLPKGTKIPVSKYVKEINSTADDILGGGALSPDSDVTKILEKLNSAKQLPFQTIKTLQTEVGATIGKIARSNPKAAELPVLYKVKAALTSAVDDAVESGAAVGLPKSKIAAYKAAKKEYARTGQIFGSPTLKKLGKRGDFGNLEAGSPPSAVISTVTKTPESAKQFMRAFKDNKEIVQQARAGLVDDSFKGSIESWPNQFAKKKEVFKEIFGNDYPEVEKLMSQIGRRNATAARATAASRGQSATAEFTTQFQKLIAQGPRTMLRILGSQAATGASVGAGAVTGNLFVGAMGVVASRVANWAEKNIELLLQRAMVEPDLRKQLLLAATKQNQSKLMKALIPFAAGIMAEDPKERMNPEVVTALKKKAMSPKLPESTKAKVAEVAALPAPAAPAAKTAPVAQKLVQAIIKQESAGNPKAVSRVGARGLMQLMPATAREVADELGVKDFDIEDPETNVRFGTYYFDKQLKRFGDEKLAIAAYNAGPERVAGWIRRYGKDWDTIAEAIRRKDPKHETLGYVKNIMRFYNT